MRRTPGQPGRTPVLPDEQARKRSFYLSDADYRRLESAADQHPIQEVSPLVRWIIVQWLNRWERERQQEEQEI